jgi:N-acetylglutamate synthase-like GNAT family acetyltransferase
MLFDVTMADVPGIVELLNVCFPEKEGGIDNSIQGVVHRLPQTIIAKEEEKIIGCCCFGCYYIGEKATSVIENLCVHPDFRKKGYADFLMKDVCKEIARYGVKIIHVACSDCSFFMRYGFKSFRYNPLSKMYSMGKELA